MRVLPLLVLLCAVVLSVDGHVSKCKRWGDICSKGSCVYTPYGFKLICGSRKLIGPAGKLCRYGGYKCFDGKVCRKIGRGRRCVFRKPHRVRSCKGQKFGTTCAKNRKCIPCYLRQGLCCRRASLIGKKNYCGVRYKVYKKCHGKKHCGYQYRFGTYCPDGKYCRKDSRGKRVCVFKKKQRKCRRFGDICGLKNNRNCLPCYYRKGYCCRRRSILGHAARICQFGGKWCPYGQYCRQTIIFGYVTRRCVYPRCKNYGDVCGYKNKRLCLKCRKGLCCRKGVTKRQCRKRCRVFWWKRCTLKGCSRGWCCKPWKVTKSVCLKNCSSRRGHHCTYKGCPRGHLGYCCRKRIYISKRKCRNTCKGLGKHCTKKGCRRGYLGYCCKKRPYVSKHQCRNFCSGSGKYCTTKGCPRGYLGYCCKKRPYVSKHKCQQSCHGKHQYCSTKNCPKNWGYYGYCCIRRPHCKGKTHC